MADQQDDIFDLEKEPYLGYEVVNDDEPQDAEDVVDDIEQQALSAIDVERKRDEYLRQIAESLSEVAEIMGSTFTKEVLIGLREPETRDATKKVLVENLIQNKVNNTILEGLQELENLEFTDEVLTPAVYERVRFMFNEALQRVYSVLETLIQYSSTIDAEGVKQLSGSIEKCRFFISAEVLSKMLQTIGEFAQDYQKGDQVYEDLEFKLNEDLHIPGYPYKQIHPINTVAANGNEDLPAIYSYYRDAINPGVTQQRLETVRAENIKTMRGEIEEMIKGLVSKIQNRVELNVILKEKGVISDAEYASVKEDPAQLLRDTIIGKISEIDLLQDARIGMLLHDEGLIDKDATKIAMLKNRLNKLTALSVEDLYERQFHDENFHDLKLGKVSLEQMFELNGIWQDVKSSLPSAASTSTEAAA